MSATKGFKDAGDDLNKAFELSPEDVDVELAMATFAISQKDFPKAQGELDRALKSHPERQDVYIRLRPVGRGPRRQQEGRRVPRTWFAKGGRSAGAAADAGRDSIQYRQSGRGPRFLQGDGRSRHIPARIRALFASASEDGRRQFLGSQPRFRGDSPGNGPLRLCELSRATRYVPGDVLRESQNV